MVEYFHCQFKTSLKALLSGPNKMEEFPLVLLDIRMAWKENAVYSAADFIYVCVCMCMHVCACMYMCFSNILSPVRTLALNLKLLSSNLLVRLFIFCCFFNFFFPFPFIFPLHFPPFLFFPTPPPFSFPFPLQWA